MDCKLIVCVYNQPDFIRLQYKSLSKFLQQSFTMCVCDDSLDKEISNEIKKVCEINNIEYLRAPYNHSGDPSSRHSAALNYALNNTDKNGFKFFGLLDSDLFLLSKLDIEKLLSHSEIATRTQHNSGLCYFSPMLCIWKAETKLQDFTWEFIPGGDTGSSTHNFHKEHPEFKVNNFSQGRIKRSIEDDVEKAMIIFGDERELLFSKIPQEISDFCRNDIEYANNKNIQYMTEFFTLEDIVFFHFVSISNWRNIEETYFNNKIITFTKAIETLLL